MISIRDNCYVEDRVSLRAEGDKLNAKRVNSRQDGIWFSVVWMVFGRPKGYERGTPRETWSQSPYDVLTRNTALSSLH